MPDLLNETVLSLGAAARLFPGARGAPTVNPSTVFRWCTKGTKCADGRLVKLEHFRAGCRVLTTREAVARYIADLTPTDPAAPSVRSPFARNKASESAGRQLLAAGA